MGPTNGTNGAGAFTSMIKSKFLDNQEELGVVAVGFSGGQVSSGLPAREANDGY